MELLATQGQITPIAFGIYHHRTATLAFQNYYNNSQVVALAMIPTLNFQSGMKLLWSDTLDVSFAFIIQEPEEFLGQLMHFKTLNALGTASTIHSEMSVISITIIHANRMDPPSVIGQFHKPLCKRGG